MTPLTQLPMFTLHRASPFCPSRLLPGTVFVGLSLISRQLMAEDATEGSGPVAASSSTYILLVVVMLVAGLYGGWVSFLMSQDPEEDQRRGRWKHIMAGLAASFLVPLFLNTISSDLLTKIFSKTDPTSILVFFGFCILAAISARKFIETLSEKVLNEVRGAQETAQQAQTKVSEIVNERQEEARYQARQEEILSTLGPLQRRAFVLVDEGTEIKHVAAILEMTEAEVAQAYEQALDTLGANQELPQLYQKAVDRHGKVGERRSNML